MKIKIEFELDHNETMDALSVLANGIRQSIYDLNDTLRNRNVGTPITDFDFDDEPLWDGTPPVRTDPHFVIKVQDENGTSYLGHDRELYAVITKEDVIMFGTQKAAELHLSMYSDVLTGQYPDHAFSIMSIQ